MKQKLINSGLTVTYIAIALIVFAMFIHVSRFNGYRRVYFADMIYGRAWRPFVYRALLPQTARLIASPIPPSIRSSINEYIDTIPFFHRIFSTIGWETEYLTEYMIAAGLMFLCLLGFGWSLRYLSTGINDLPPKYNAIIPFLGILTLPPLFNYTYIYDFSTLFLFTLGLAHLVRRNWLIYFIIFTAGCLNKETIILLTAIYVAYYQFNTKLSRKKFVELLIFQLSIFVLIRLYLQWIFRNNPGSFIEYHLLDHNLPLLYQLIKPYPLSVFIALFTAVCIFFYQWSSQPRFLKLSFYCVVPVLLILTLFFGFLEEWRDYYEAFPIILLIFIYSIYRIIGTIFSNRPPLLEHINS